MPPPAIVPGLNPAGPVPAAGLGAGLAAQDAQALLAVSGIMFALINSAMGNEDPAKCLAGMITRPLMAHMQKEIGQVLTNAGCDLKGLTLPGIGGLGGPKGLIP